jgi:TP901 family phage tail tape measure protein
MVDDVNANIGVNIDTSSAIASLKNLQREISLFHTQMARGGATANAQAAQLQSSLLNAVNATGRFQASMTRVNSTTEAFTTALEKNKLTMSQYFRYAGGASKSFGRFFRSEFDTISKVAVERVKDLQTQYISMGRDANGALQSIKIRPLSLDMDNLATKTMVAAQKQQLFNQLLTQGSTNLLNFGKNTQWAGRQLMVGFTLPLTLFATSAAKSFMEIEKQVIRIRRVYGDFGTTVEETDTMIDLIKSLASEYTKYGVAVSDTLGLAAEAAAMGQTGQQLLAQISEATRLAVLGNVEQSEALETTISITNAFGVATEDLANKIDFLNAVENQSVTSIEDLTIAIPKAGPVVQQLGGNVEDLAFFLTAMKEGGINASEGANALKSGLAALINPTGKASEMLEGFGININKIVESNKGDVKGLVIDFASALDTLDPLNRARAIEQLFGKFQFSRLSTLFQNVIGEGTQASRVLELTQATTQELAILSQRELEKVESTTTYKFEKAFADFQAALAPVGEAFLKAVTPVIEFGTKLLNQFNSMGDGAKNFTVILTTVVAGIGPVLLMTVGLVANGVANLIKMFQLLGGIFRKTGADTGILGTQTDYMTQQQIEAAAVAASLNQSHSKLTQTFSVEAAALNSLTLAYQKAITAQRGFGGAGAVPGSSTKPKKYAKGVVSVPGP